MATPIPSSLSQMLNPPSATSNAPARPVNSGAGFTSALSAQKAFFQQVAAPAARQITPPTYKAADIAKAAPQVATPQVTSPQAQTDTPLKRPGSYLNIVI